MSVCIEHNNFKCTKNHLTQNLSADNKATKFSLVGFPKLNIFVYIKVWNARYRQRKNLAKLDERMLADIGYTYIEACEEFKKPFWK